MIILKDSQVNIDGLKPQMYYAVGVAAALKHRLYGLNCVITAALDGVHNPGSLHPEGYAVDLRSHDLSPTEAISWAEAIKAELNPLGFDVVFEGGTDPQSPASTGSHLHCEFDPKPGEKFWHVLGEN